MTTAIEVRQNGVRSPYSQPTTITPDEWPIVLQQAKMLCTTGFLPKAVDTPEKAIAIMMKGREIGIPAMYALSNITVIQGKPTCNSELMLALIYRDHGDEAVQFIESNERICRVVYKRRRVESKSFQFTWEQAVKAELTSGPNAHSWRKYPDAMLRARCISAVARLAFPDTIAGMYTPEELGVSEDMESGEIRLPINEEGEVGKVGEGEAAASLPEPTPIRSLEDPEAPEPPAAQKEWKNPHTGMGPMTIEEHRQAFRTQANAYMQDELGLTTAKRRELSAILLSGQKVDDAELVGLIGAWEELVKLTSEKQALAYIEASYERAQE